MARDYRAEHEIACQALEVAKERADREYEIPKGTILFKKVDKNGNLRVGYKDYDSGEHFKMIPIKEVLDRGINVDDLPEYTEFSKRYHEIYNLLSRIKCEASFKSRQAVRNAKTESLKRFYHERREIYDSYMSSPEWSAKRQLCYQHHGTTCVDCGKAYATDIHHKHYEILGDECPVNDIVPLCSSCHEARHNNGNLTAPAGGGQP
jgi:5-methylcytosine-specific restriction endonuclease McrA